MRSIDPLPNCTVQIFVNTMPLSLVIFQLESVYTIKTKKFDFFFHEVEGLFFSVEN